jgi:hypothetical protein
MLSITAAGRKCFNFVEALIPVKRRGKRQYIHAGSLRSA